MKKIMTLMLIVMLVMLAMWSALPAFAHQERPVDLVVSFGAASIMQDMLFRGITPDAMPCRGSVDCKSIEPGEPFITLFATLILMDAMSTDGGSGWACLDEHPGQEISAGITVTDKTNAAGQGLLLRHLDGGPAFAGIG